MTNILREKTNREKEKKMYHSKSLIVALIKLIPYIIKDLFNGEEVTVTIKK